MVGLLDKQQRTKDLRVSCDSRGNAMKGHCNVSSWCHMSQRATSRPQLHIRPSCLFFFQRISRLQEAPRPPKVSERPGCLQALSCHPVLHRFCPPSSRLFGTARSASCTQLSQIKAYLCQGADRPNSLELVGGGVGAVKVVGGSSKKTSCEVL